MEEQRLRTMEWRGQTRYCCPECGFDGPSESDVLRHWQGTHARNTATPTGPTLFDADDKPIQKEPEEKLIDVPPALRDLARRSPRRRRDPAEL